MQGEIKITLTEAGQFQLAIAGSAGANKVVALGMLEMAKDFLLRPPQAKPRLAIPDGPMPDLRNGG